MVHSAGSRDETAGWTAMLPDTMQVLERGWLSSNNILFTGPLETALVDSGYHSHAEQTVGLVRASLAHRNLDRIVTTHLHSDHCGGNAALQRVYRCHTVIPRAEADLVAHWREADFSFIQTGQRLERFAFQGTLLPGDSIELGGLSWEALAAPGHDPHALMLYCAKEEILISADALWEQGFGVVFPELQGRPGFADTHRTLTAIAALRIRLVIPGHGAPFTDVDKALQNAFARLDYLAADPRRNARHAVKVLLKFLLLESQSLPLAALPEGFARLPLVAEINARFLGLAPGALCEWASGALIDSGAAARDGSWLVNREPGSAARPPGRT